MISLTKGLAALAPTMLRLAADLTNADQPLDDFSMIGTLITFIVVLAIIIGLIVISLKFLAQKNQAWSQAKSLRHLGGISVGQNKSVQLIKIGNHIYVVGVGDDVQLLQKIENESEIETILTAINSHGFNNQGMLNGIKNWISDRRTMARYQDQQASPEAESFQELFHSKIQQISGNRQKLKDLLDQEDDVTDGKKR